MTVNSLLALLFIGLIAGWLASRVVKKRRLSLLGYLIVGVVGAFIGNFLLNFVGLHAYNLAGQLISAFIGSVVFLAILQLIR